jgi:hypothetical protein
MDYASVIFHLHAMVAHGYRELSASWTRVSSLVSSRRYLPLARNPLVFCYLRTLELS